MRFNKKIAVYSALILLLTGVIVAIVDYRGRDRADEKEIEEIEEENYELMVMTVIDFKGNIESDKLEARYSVNDAKTFVYRNNENIGESTLTASENISILELEPEKKLNNLDYSTIAIEDFEGDINYTYDIDIVTTEKYLVSLINNYGYELVRRVNTATYCEAYLKDKDNNVLRVIATSDRMAIAPLKEGIELKEITEYFMKDGGTENED